MRRGEVPPERMNSEPAWPATALPDGYEGWSLLEVAGRIGDEISAELSQWPTIRSDGTLNRYPTEQQLAFSSAELDEMFSPSERGRWTPSHGWVLLTDTAPRKPSDAFQAGSFFAVQTER